MRAYFYLFMCIGVVICSGCKHSAVGREPDEYVGCAADEHWVVFDDVIDIVSEADAPVFTAPMKGMELPATPPLFTWSASATNAGTPAGDVGMACEGWNTGFASLHLAPISGTIYDLQITLAGSVVYRVLTTLQEWKASTAVWSGFAGKSISMKLRRMAVLKNERQAGPFGSTVPTAFSIAR